MARSELKLDNCIEDRGFEVSSEKSTVFGMLNYMLAQMIEA